MDDKLSLKGAWLHHVIQFKFLVPLSISGISKARHIKFCTLVGHVKCLQCFDAVGWVVGRDPACKN